jgi:pimeloyl-ACP methyl ester carboxylesterase
MIMRLIRPETGRLALTIMERRCVTAIAPATMAAMRTVFMHGAGRAGPSAWPGQSAQERSDWVFLDRAPDGDQPRADAVRILDALGDGGHLVAASYGALAAMLGAELDPGLVFSLVLCEPACFSVARGCPAVEAHVAALAPVFAVAGDRSVSAAEFSGRFAAGMGTPPPDLPPDVLAVTVARLRSTVPPWEVVVSELVPSHVPTLVLTGSSDPTYDEVAMSLVALGARHVALDGAGHRPQDRADGVAAITEFWSQLGGRPSRWRAR